ncbi:MAG: alpha/beta hydrolase fold domain-containing protein [bacterium]
MQVLSGAGGMKAVAIQRGSRCMGPVARSARLRVALFVFGLLPMAVFAQTRYKEVCFQSYNESFNIKYGQAGTNSLYLDYWEPAGDVVSKRAAMVWVHGGGFTGGDKSQADYRTWARTLARHGYVSVSINYRLSSDYTGNIGQQDARAAVRWLRANAESLRIDTSRIAIGGGSAGSIISMAVAYWEGPEGDSGNPGYSSEVAAVIDLWGWLHPVTEMQAGEAPIAIVHGTADETVSFSEATAIHARADVVGMPHTWHPIQGGPHWSYPTVTANFSWVTDFLYDYMILATNLAPLPAAPSNLVAVTASSTQINLAWTDRATNELAYTVERSLDSNTWVLVAVTGANTTTASDTGLSTNTLYYYRVAASNAGGLSAFAYASGRTWTAYEAWQYANFTAAQLTNSAVSGSAVDADCDGLSNEQEYWAGTDPNRAASCLILYATTNAPTAVGEFLVRWQSATGRVYTVQAATSLVAGFTNMVLHVPATPPVNVHTDTVGSAGQKFYRIQVE